MVQIHEAEVRITLRLPAYIHAKLIESASETSRSMNGEIVARLVESFAETRIGDDEVRAIQGQYIEALSAENEALKKAGVAGEQIVFQLASAISKAAAGDRTELDRLVEQERERPILKRLTTVWSVIDDGH